MLQFDSEKGFYVSEIEDVRAEVTNVWKEAFRQNGQGDLNTEPETPAGQIIDSQTASITEKDAELLYLCNQFNPLKNEGVFQDAIAKIYFLTRKPAINSQANISITGLAGVIIPVQAQLRSVADGTTWQNKDPITIGADGTAEGVFYCTDEGPISAGANTISRIVTQVAGWDTANNSAPAIVGTYAETRGSFENRRYNSVALNSRGTIASVYARIMQLDGVISAYVTENKTSVNKIVDGVIIKPHSVFCCVLGGESGDIAKALYDTVSAGCDYTGNTEIEYTDPNVGSVELIRYELPYTLNMYVKVIVRTTMDLPTGYETAIKDAVYNNFYGNDETLLNNQPLLRVTMNTDLYASRFDISVLNAGVPNLIQCLISKDGSSFVSVTHIPINANPILSRDNIIIEMGA